MLVTSAFPLIYCEILNFKRIPRVSQFHLSFHHMYNTLYSFYSLTIQLSVRRAQVSTMLLFPRSSWHTIPHWTTAACDKLLAVSQSLLRQTLGELKASPYPGYIESKISYPTILFMFTCAFSTWKFFVAVHILCYWYALH